QNPDAEVRLLAYDILSADQHYRFNNAHYAFETCICNRPSRDPKLSRFCTCADLKGRTIGEGAVNDTERCSNDKRESGCLESPMYYLRVSANGFVLTQPGWQEITQGDNKTTSVTLRSISGTPISLTFSITEHLQQWNNRGSTGRIGEERRPVVKEKKDRPWFLMTSTASPYWTRVRPTQPTKTTTTTSSPVWERNELQENELETTLIPATTDYLRFTKIGNMYELRNVLYMESIRDQIPAYQLDVQDYKNEIIAHHNAIRALHGVGALEYDPYLEMEAQRWASMLGARSSCVAHDPNRRHGECLFYFGGLTLPNARTLAALTVQSFYLEKNSYDYNNYRPVFFYRTGHFTQLVWRATRRIGVGVHIGLASGGGAPCRPFAPTYQLYVVVKYDPPGNVQSSYAYKNNV
ncbi:hypothetical protein PENTCL1PPCAC_30023, partial [Pristionchus entomophagus]